MSIPYCASFMSLHGARKKSSSVREVNTTICSASIKLHLLIFFFLLLKEIYAPKIQEFAYVTDGACSEDDIVRMELIMLKVITWCL